MNRTSYKTPVSHDSKVDWDSIESDFPCLAALRGCIQDSQHHAEGDVYVHTRMVADSVLSNPEWQSLSESEREIVLLASILHDIGKPACTKIEGDRVTSRGHSKRGAIMARSLLWSLGVPIETREQIVNLIRFHQIPFFLIEKDTPCRTLFEVSQTARCDLLAVVAEADARGRTCVDKQKLLDNISLFRELASENDCLKQAKQFPSDHSRFLYFRNQGRDPEYMAHDDTACEVAMMSGFPGAGKDTWITRNLVAWPVISLDEIRRQMKISPKENQGPVVAAAKEKAREYLRRTQSFVWNATNVSRQMRELSINLFAAYKARVRITYVEVGEEALFSQNAKRDSPAPASVIRKLIEKWEVPDLTEAHTVEWFVNEQD